MCALCSFSSKLYQWRSRSIKIKGYRGIVFEDRNNYRRYNNVAALNAILQLFADIILYGHAHRSSVIYGDDKIYINCGSLGCTSTCEGIVQGGILSIEKHKTIF